MKHYLAIDIGGTAIKYGLISETGDLLEKEEMATEAYKGGPLYFGKGQGLGKDLSRPNGSGWSGHFFCRNG